MTKFKPISPDSATGETKEAFDEAQKQFGGVINLFKIAGHAPNVLKGLLTLNKEIGKSEELDGKLTEQVAMLVSALNRCDYCVNVHMQVGKSVGLSEESMVQAIKGEAQDAKAQALLDFTNEVVRSRGLVNDATLEKVLDAGFSHKALLETVGIIGLYTTLQYIRHVGKPEHDFELVDAFDPDTHGASIS